MAQTMSWALPLRQQHRLAAGAGPLTFVGSVGDFDEARKIRRPGELFPQIAGALENLASALAAESCGLDDVVRLKAFYRSDGQTSEWSVLGALADAFGLLPGPAITANPVPHQPWAGRRRASPRSSTPPSPTDCAPASSSRCEVRPLSRRTGRRS